MIGCIFCLTLANRGPFQAPDQSAKSPHKIEQTFTLPGESLVIGRAPNAKGALGETRIGLVLRSPEGERLIGRLSDLNGDVVIDTPRKALEFVRLNTSPVTQELLSSDVGIEIIPKSALDSDFVYGVTLILPGLRASRDGVWGLLSDRTFEEYGLTRPSVRKVRDYYVVERTVLQQDFSFQMVPKRAVEEVGVTGNYMLTELSRVHWKGRAIAWDVPAAG